MTTVQEYISQSTQAILSFLEDCLPQIGGDSWWQENVLEKLSDHQRKLAEQKKYSALNDFDLAALLNILERNWRAITGVRFDLDYRRGLNLIIELKNIRNHYAHEPTSGTPLDQKLRDVDSVNRLLKMLGADPSMIARGEELHRDLMILILDGGKGQGENETPVTVSAAPDIDQDSQDDPEMKQDDVHKGLPLHWLKAGSILERDVLNSIGSATYVGIDFGTSTSVVSIAFAGEDGQGLKTKALEIRQLDELGREIDSHLVDTCLAWFNENLLFGVGAARLKQELVANQTVWTSFKMGLGVDLGPEYNRTALPEGRYEYTIEKPQHAAAIFLKFLCDGVREYVRTHALPEKIFYTVTVPASFEANQRKDLFAALEFAGIEGSEIRLMDEPNAAFLSYLIDMESRSSQGRFIETLQARSRNVIVFDFGAGTCDISILEVSVSQDSILSRNLGISKFWALGGDDIDRAIAGKVLLPQLVGGEGVAKYLFTTTQLEQQVLPRLKPVAEALKIACCELAEQKGWKTIEDLKSAGVKVTTKPSTPFVIQGKTWKIDDPQINLDQFAEVMALFVGQKDNPGKDTGFTDVLQPIDNALEKVELTKEHIDLVLYIGGSCENPLIRHYVSKHLGRFVENVTPRDLRAHVSQGAALYTLLLRGADIDPIRPITSETIYVLTVGEHLEPIVKAGTLVPSEGMLDEELEVKRDSQKTIDLPFFAGSVNKPLGLIQIKAPRGSGGFKRGEKLKIKWRISKEKILNVIVEAGAVTQDAAFHNPLANSEVTAEVLALLKAKHAFNQSVLDGGGRPAADITLAYAYAAQKANQWRLAAEMFEAVERLDSQANHSTSICYCYSRDGDNKASCNWASIAYERRPSATTAYNLALNKMRNNDIREYEQLMQECLGFDPNYKAALLNYGKYLLEKGEAKGSGYIQKAFDIYKAGKDEGTLDSDDINRFRLVAKILGKEEELASIEILQSTKATKNIGLEFNAENLVGRQGSSEEDIMNPEGG